jgi:hypothetical protein
MNLRLLLIPCVYGLLTQTAMAQQAKEEVAVLGLKSGKVLGEEAFLPALVAKGTQILRTGLLIEAPEENKKVNTEVITKLQEKLVALLGENSKYTTELIPFPVAKEDTGMLHNEALVDLAQQYQKDIIIFATLEPIGDKYWLLLRAYAGVQGKVLYSRKINYPGNDSTKEGNVESEDLNAEKNIDAEIRSFLSANEISPAVNKIAELPTELRLDTTPGNMHVYIGDRLVGLSPLILRGVSADETDLKVFEQMPYQISRIKIVSSPPGIEVFVNNEKQGVTPIEFPPEIRAVGTYDIRFASRGDFEAEIQIQTDPENIPVQLNQSLVQRTPVSFQELDQKTYTLTLHPYRPISVTYPLNRLTSPAHIEPYKYAKLILNASVKDAEVKLNDEVMGETPYSANLPQGKHLLTLSKNRFRTQNKTLFLDPGKTQELFFNLEPRSADTSIFFTPTGEITPQLNIAGKFLGFGRVETLPVVLPYRNESAQLYGVEIDYGWPEIYRFSDNFTLGFEMSAAYFALQSESYFRQYPGIGSKVQFLRESDNIPISAAVGGYFTLDPARLNAVGYLSLSRNFGDFALHLGLQTHGFNLNVGYTGWDNIRIGGVVYADSFFKLLTENGEKSTGSFYGLQAGYSF